MLASQTDSVKINIWTKAPDTGQFTKPPTGQFITAFIQGKQQITSWLADNISNDERRLSLAQSEYVVEVAPMPRFTFSVAMTNNFRKIHRDLQPTRVGRSQHFATVPRSKEAIYNPLELPSGGFSFSKDPPVIHCGFADVSPSRVGGVWEQHTNKNCCGTALFL